MLPGGEPRGRLCAAILAADGCGVWPVRAGPSHGFLLRQRSPRILRAVLAERHLVSFPRRADGPDTLPWGRHRGVARIPMAELAGFSADRNCLLICLFLFSVLASPVAAFENFHRHSLYTSHGLPWRVDRRGIYFAGGSDKFQAAEVSFRPDGDISFDFCSR